MSSHSFAPGAPIEQSTQPKGSESVERGRSHRDSADPEPTKLAIVRVVHTIIYATMASAVLYVFYCGLTGRRDRLLTVAASLVAFEGLIFLANGMRCPLTALAQKYGDPTGHVGDTIFPEACTRYTFRVFGTLYAIGLLFIAANYLIG